MVTLRCTQKLCKYLGVEPVDSPEPTTAVLGDWYANLIPTDAGDLIIFVNEQTLLTVAIPAEESENLIPLFRLRVANLLGLIGIHKKAIEREISHLKPVQFGKTEDRSVIGSMSNIAGEYQLIAEGASGGDNLSLSKAELKLSEMPSSPLGYRTPCDVAPKFLGRQR